MGSVESTVDSLTSHYQSQNQQVQDRIDENNNQIRIELSRVMELMQMRDELIELEHKEEEMEKHNRKLRAKAKIQESNYFHWLKST